MDLCPFAVAGPKPMLGSCSTRDGRSRVKAPSAPHLTWTTKLPTDATGHLGLSALVTDAANHAYLVTQDNFDDVGAIRRVRLDDGADAGVGDVEAHAIDWTTTIAPDSATAAPVLLATGPVDLFAYDAGDKESLLMFDPATGTSLSTTFGFDLYYGPPHPAVGVEGSLYLIHSANVGSANTQTFLSRVRPGGTVAWTSVDLATLAPPLENPGSWTATSLVALGVDDLAVVVLPGAVREATIAADGTIVALGSTILALEPLTGATLWELAPPDPASCIADAALTSAGAIVGLQCSGTVFGAGE